MNRKLAIALSILLAIILLMALGPTGFLVGLTTALLPVPLYVALALWLDRHEPEPRHLLLEAFVWGMLVASIISLVMNAAAIAYLQMSLGLSDTTVRRTGQILASPVFEELSKGAALFVLFHRERDEFDNIMDGAVYAAMIGLGFAATENILYYGHALANDRLGFVFALRGLASPFAHPLFTAMTGLGFGWAREATSRRQGALRVLYGLGAAIALHALWNAAGAAHLFTWAYALIMVPTFIGVIVLLESALTRERRIVRHQLRRTVDESALPAAELDMVCGHDSPTDWWIRRFGAGDEQRRVSRLHDARLAAVELGFACWHAERRHDDAAARVPRLRALFDDALAEWRQCA